MDNLAHPIVTEEETQEEQLDESETTSPSPGIPLGCGNPNPREEETQEGQLSSNTSIVDSDSSRSATAEESKDTYADCLGTDEVSDFRKIDQRQLYDTDLDDPSNDLINDLAPQLIQGNLLRCIEINQANPTAGCPTCSIFPGIKRETAAPMGSDYLPAVREFVNEEQPVIPKAQGLLYEDHCEPVTEAIITEDSELPTDDKAKENCSDQTLFAQQAEKEVSVLMRRSSERFTELPTFADRTGTYFNGICAFFFIAHGMPVKQTSISTYISKNVLCSFIKKILNYLILIVFVINGLWQAFRCVSFLHLFF